MSLTRAAVETILVKRTSKLLVKASMAVTIVGSNADLNDPIGWAIRQVGGSVATITAVTDSDLSGISTDDYDALLDFAELRTLMNILGNLDGVDVKLGPRAESLSQLAKQVQTRIDKLETKLDDVFGYNAPTLETGVLSNDFAQHNEVILTV